MKILLPDFICQLRDSRILVVECKGENITAGAAMGPRLAQV